MNKEVVNKPKKQVAIELLRIYAMFGIITEHFFLYSGSRNVTSQNPFDATLAEFLYNLFFNGSELFVLVGAYFLCKDKTPRWDRLKKLLIQVVFFEIILLIVALNFNNREFNEDLVWSMIRDHWFIQAYIALYIIHPVLNILINALTKKQHLIIVIAGFFYYSVLGHMLWSSPLGQENGYSVTFFVYLYLVSAFIRNFVDLEKLRSIIHPAYFLILYILSAIVCCKMQLLVNVDHINLHYSSTGFDAPWFIIKSFSLFFFALTLKLQFPKLIEKILLFFASNVFGVYLLHENALCGNMIWKNVTVSNLPAGFSFWGYYFVVCLIILIAFSFISRILMVFVNLLDKYVIISDYAKPAIKKIRTGFENLFAKKTD